MERNDTEVIFGIPTPSKITEVAASAVAQVRVRASAAAQGWCFCCPRIVSTLDASWSKIARSITELEVRLSAHLALLLRGRPRNLVRAVTHGATTASGIILQFPFYAGIFGVINNTGLGAWLGELFVQIATTETYPAIVYLYSGFMNLFVPSAGSKWLIEAPYLLPAAKELGVSATTTVLAYAYGDSTTNLIQPFWAIPILTVTGLRFGDVLGYTGLVAIACFGISMIAMYIIPATL